MTTIQLYRKHKTGEISREKFLYEVRRDNNLPFITNLTSYDDAVKILKNKGVITEVDTKEAKADEAVKAETKAKAPSTKKPSSLSIDVANPYEYRHGLQYELEQGDDYSDEALEKAKTTVLKNLAKDANFYSTLLNQKQSHYEFKAPETDAPGMQAKADGYLKKELKKDEKANVKDNLSKSEAAKGKPKGVKEMPDKGVEGKEKVVKEGIDGGIIGKIKDFVGSKGFQFGVRRPSEEEDKIAVDHFSDYENKKVNSIGVDKITGNIYAANDDYEVVLSPKGKVLKSDTSITGKYNKDALDAYQGELEKDADKYYKRQDIKNKLKSLVGYKPDEFGDYRFEDKEKVVKEGLEEAKKSNEIEWISSDFSPIKGIKVKKGDKGEIVNRDTGDQYLVKFNNHRFYANTKDFKEGLEEAKKSKYITVDEEGDYQLNSKAIEAYLKSAIDPEEIENVDIFMNDDEGYGESSMYFFDNYTDEFWKYDDPTTTPDKEVEDWVKQELSYWLFSSPDEFPSKGMSEDIESSPVNGDSSAEGQFNNLMSRYDWYYEMSDDPRKYDTGTALDQKLKSLAKTIGTDRAVELFNLKAPSDRKVTSTFFMEVKDDKHAKLKEILKAGLKKEIINPKDIIAAKSTGDVVNIPVQDTAAQTAAKNAKINFRTYK